MGSRQNISLGWSEGRFFDVWMLVHFMSGVAGGFSNIFFRLSVAQVYALGLALMVVWEGAETLFGVSESWENRVLDVAVGLAGVAAALWLSARVDLPSRAGAFWLSFLIASVGSFLGWRAHRRRAADVRIDGPAG